MPARFAIAATIGISSAIRPMFDGITNAGHSSVAQRLPPSAPESVSFADSARAALSAAGFPNRHTQHKAAEHQPEGRRGEAAEDYFRRGDSGGHRRRENSSAVINSGNSGVAHSTMVTPTISEGSRGCVNQSDIPVSCRIFQQVYGDRQGE